MGAACACRAGVEFVWEEQIMRSSLLVLAAALGCFAVGCGADGDSSAKEQVAQEGAALVFDSPFADGGTFRVVSTSEGRLAFSIQAPIGSEAARLAQRASAIGTKELSQIYLTLHPESAAVPAELDALSARFAAEHANDPAPTAPTAAAEAPVTDKSISTFQSAVCHDYATTNHDVFTLVDCKYAVNAHSIASYGTMATKDRSFGWNETGYVATHSLSASTWQPTIPAYTYYWTEWGGSYSNATVSLTLPSGAYGPIGITAHSWHYR